MQEVIFTVTGMTWGHCKAAVSRALSALPGVRTVAVDLANRKVTVSYDPGLVSLAAMRGAISSAGYEAEA